MKQHLTNTEHRKRANSMKKYDELIERNNLLTAMLAFLENHSTEELMQVVIEAYEYIDSR